MVLTLLLEQPNATAKLCADESCTLAAEALSSALAKGLFSPDELCDLITLCPKSAGCALFPSGTWPPTKLPPQPPADPPNKRKLLTNALAGHEHGMRALAAAITRVAGGDAKQPSHTGFYDAARAMADVLATAAGVLTRAEATREAAKALVARNVGVGQPVLAPWHPCSPFNISCLVDRIGTQHLPISDRDADGFAPRSDRGLRGSHWRGADCGDGDADVYPGRLSQQGSSSPAEEDHDCNGIVGSNATGSYEDLLCGGIERRGFIHIGDSATAHFHLPPAWITRTGWNLANVLDDAMDELDQVACSWGTGHKSAGDCPPTANATAATGLSLAMRLRQRNRCNHRDFQNIGVNGPLASPLLLLPRMTHIARLLAPAHRPPPPSLLFGSSLRRRAHRKSRQPTQLRRAASVCRPPGSCGALARGQRCVQRPPRHVRPHDAAGGLPQQDTRSTRLAERQAA
jgi:hypothetical protein